MIPDPRTYRTRSFPASAIAGYARPAIAAPTMGAAQKTHNCANAQPPTKIAGPVLRAGFTDRLVTGTPIRWISVRPSPMAMGAKPWGARRTRSTRTRLPESARAHVHPASGGPPSSPGRSDVRRLTERE